jgi:hypothetical protein
LEIADAICGNACDSRQLYSCFFQSNNNAMSPFLAGNDEILRMTAKSLCELHELTSISEHMRNFWIQ